MKSKGRNAASIGNNWKVSRILYFPFLQIFFYEQYSFYMTAPQFFPLHIVVVCTCTECFDLFSGLILKFQGKRVPDSAYVKYVHMVQSSVACGMETHIKTYDC